MQLHFPTHPTPRSHFCLLSAAVWHHVTKQLHLLVPVVKLELKYMEDTGVGVRLEYLATMRRKKVPSVSSSNEAPAPGVLCF